MNALRRASTRKAKGVPANPDAAAAYWSAKRRLNTLGPSESAAFQAWLADPTNAAAYHATEQVMDSAGDCATGAEVRAMREAALSITPSRVGSSGQWRFAGAGLLAACLTGVVVVAGQGLFERHEPQSLTPIMSVGSPSASAANAAVQRYSTSVGERSNITLADGSVVSLNTASLLEVAYTRDRRDVRLLAGQALFKVAKNKARPFVVTAGDRRITATGTAFDVRVDHGRVKVVLVEGHVIVTPLKRNGLAILIPAISQQELAPGEALVAAPALPVSIAAADVEQATSWQKGQVIFRDDTLAAAVAEMNRYSANQIIVEDPGVANLKISGVFGSSRPENFVAAVTAFYPLRAERRSPGMTALVWRQGNRTTGG